MLPGGRQTNQIDTKKATMEGSSESYFLLMLLDWQENRACSRPKIGLFKPWTRSYMSTFRLKLSRLIASKTNQMSGELFG